MGKQCEKELLAFNIFVSMFFKQGTVDFHFFGGLSAILGSGKRAAFLKSLAKRAALKKIFISAVDKAVSCAKFETAGIIADEYCSLYGC